MAQSVSLYPSEQALVEAQLPSSQAVPPPRVPVGPGLQPLVSVQLRMLAQPRVGLPAAPGLQPLVSVPVRVPAQPRVGLPAAAGSVQPQSRQAAVQARVSRLSPEPLG